MAQQWVRRVGRRKLVATTQTCETTDPVRVVGERLADGMGFKEAGLSPTAPASWLHRTPLQNCLLQLNRQFHVGFVDA